MKPHCTVLEDKAQLVYQGERLLEQMGLGQIINFCEVVLELINACGCHCFFCPHDRMTRGYGIMSDESIRIVARQLNHQLKKEFRV